MSTIVPANGLDGDGRAVLGVGAVDTAVTAGGQDERPGEGRCEEQALEIQFHGVTSEEGSDGVLTCAKTLADR
ncbi:MULTISPECIES: hypothetical protein [Rhodococcus]|uniref:hypothetical protein n=1 Tax=Rhodococcus TaxID=1827 RepID=UPI001E4745EC|nr:hypothetical protein [Rhodococcus pyridinivorans]MCD2118862.1 hypothetical protein [Rhodococcus pyridinivorans]MCZ4627793.1 hypothetical protein [Rhodococcus pyridinivorans]MCZ4648945.1 hypothetical protein [Rhodococcus pyridinivorans]MDJ0483491.1 hypothetical protein [Rhodococcus pyridinivorans]MDV7255108.1 hypothetical protein [Rhodococcus pyridinivorans]